MPSRTRARERRRPRRARSGGVRVAAGDGEAEARRINEAFFKQRETGLPFVIAKFAASLDGRIAAASGDSRWVSGPTAREWSHRLRTRIDAIICGSDTVIIDDPVLTARPDGIDAERQPLRVVVDSRGRVCADGARLRAHRLGAHARRDDRRRVARVAVLNRGTRVPRS